MEFVTIHDLSRELNTSERVIRYRLVSLVAEGKLKEYEDFRRDDFKDDQHFVWKIHPLRFLHESGLERDAPPLSTTASNSGNESSPSVNQPANTPPSFVSRPAELDRKTDNKVDTKPAEPSLEREFINVLKEQIGVKDAQLRDQGEQLKDEHELNMKLIGTTLQQAQEINKLLRLTSGKTDLSEVVAKDGSVDNKADNQQPPVDNDIANSSGKAVNDGGTVRAA